jgi:Peptidase family M28/PA domain
MLNAEVDLRRLARSPDIVGAHSSFSIRHSAFSIQHSTGGFYMRRIATAIIFAATVGLAAQERAPEIESITARDMKADLTFLASDSMAGRLTDTPQNAMAAEWIASRFERLGLKPIGDNGSYYQKYTLATATLGEGNQGRIGAFGTDWYPTRFSASGTAEGALVFVGYGISSPERNHDDYRGDVKGAIVLALDHEPGERDESSPFDGVVTAQAADQLQKALAAQARGAIGILFVSDVHNHPAPANANAATGLNLGAAWPERPPRIPRYMLGSWVEQVKIPAAVISVPAVKRLLSASSALQSSFEDLAKSADTPGGVKPTRIGIVPQFTTVVTRKFIDDRNVVAMIEGSDPTLKDEVVIVCAHYDHDGTNGENVLNGADDDGSGTIGVIEIAEAYALAAAKGLRPKRSVLFAAWNSEERGLFGAWAYTQQPIVPLAKTVAVLNMDMIGRNEEVPEGSAGGRFRGLEVQTAESNNNAVNIIGTTRSASLKQVVEKANAGIGLTLRLRYDNNISQLMRRSDHWPFLNKGVPAVWVHTGLHPDYHTVNDDADRINYPKMEKIGRLVHQASWDLANAPVRPSLDRR